MCFQVFTSLAPSLEDLYLSHNDLRDPGEEEGFQHDQLQRLYLSCNQMEDFDAVTRRVAAR